MRHKLEVEKIEYNLGFVSDSHPNNYTKLIIFRRISEYCETFVK